MLITENTPLNRFAKGLQDPAFFAEVGPSFALLKPGDWQGFLRWAAALGYVFTLQALHTLCRDNPQILGQMEKSESLSGWNLESLQRAAQAEAN